MRASGPHCRGHTTAKAGLEHRSIRPIRQDQQCWYERPAGPISRPCKPLDPSTVDSVFRPHCRGHPTAKAGLEHRSIRPIRQDHQCWYERPAGPAGIRPTIRNTSACPAPSRPLSPARAYAVVRRTRRRGGVVRGAAVPVGRAPRGVACACCARYSTSWSPASSSSCSLMML